MADDDTHPGEQPVDTNTTLHVHPSGLAAWDGDGLTALVASGTAVAEPPTLEAQLAAIFAQLPSEARAQLSTALLATEEGEDESDGDDAGVELAEPVPGNPAPAERTPTDASFDPPEGGVPFSIPMLVTEGYETSDHRYIEPGALGRRSLPLTIMAMRQNPDGGWGHDAAVVAARLDTLERFDASAVINPETSQPYGAGVWGWAGTGYVLGLTDVEQSTLQYVRDGVLRGISADIGEAESEYEVLEVDEDGWPTSIRERITQGAIMGGTICPFPAFPGAFVELDGTVPAAAEEEAVVASGAMAPFRIVGAPGCDACDEGLVASAATLTELPPAAWYQDPKLGGPTPLTVDRETGRVYGHLALWGQCHVGVGDACLTAPRSRTNYSAFRLKDQPTAEGEHVAVGHITLGTGHADTRLGMQPALEHYDNTGAQVATVAAGEDDHGVWLAGSVKAGVTDAQLNDLAGSCLSGDWRRQGVGLELMAALCVNVPGFPVPQPQAVAASGQVLALVAAGAPALAAATGVDTTKVDNGVAKAVQAALAPFLPLAALSELERIRARAS